MNVVLDTNVLIAAFLKRSFSDRVLRRCLRGNLKLYTSKEILDELGRKLKMKFQVPEATTRAFLSFIEKVSIVVVPNDDVPSLPRHLKNDTHLFTSALKAGADILVTMDRALLRMKRFENTVILHPRTLPWTFPEKNSTH